MQNNQGQQEQYDVFSPEIGLDDWLNKGNILETYKKEDSALLPNYINGVSVSGLSSGEQTALVSVVKKTFSDSAEGKIEGFDTDNRYKWIIGNATNSIDWSVTTLNTLTVIGTISGSVVIGGELHIPDEDTTANSFHVETDGDTWWGATQTNWTADHNNATAYVLSTGVAQFQSVTVTGGSSTITGNALVGGWTATSSGTLANGTNIILDATNKAISINNATFEASGIQFQYNAGTPRGYIGNGSTEYFKFDGTNISWASPNTSLSTAGKLTTVSADIGGWNVVSGYIYNLVSGTPTSSPSDGLVLASGNEGLSIYEDTEKRIELGYLSSGVYGLKGYGTNGSDVIFELSDTQQKLAGWYLTTTTIADNTTAANAKIFIDSANTLIRAGATTGNYLTFDGNNLRLRSSNYVSGFAGSGFTLEPDLLEVGNIACRGLFRTYVLQKDILSVNAGSLLVTPNADVLDADMDGFGSMTIKGTTTFSASDILRIKDGSNDEWMTVIDTSSAPTYIVSRDKNNDYITAYANLVGWWKLDESAANNTITDSVGSNTGTSARNTNLISATGKIGRCLDFTPASSDTITITDSDSLSFGDSVTDNPFSISAWIYMDDSTTFYIIQKWNGNTNNREWDLSIQGGKIYFTLADEVSGNPVFSYIGRYYNTTLTAYEGQWVHITATYDGSSTVGGLKIYLNNTRIDDTNFTGGVYTAMHNNTSNVYIGSNAATNNFANGKFDEIRLYNKELSLSEVQSITNGEFPSWKKGATVANYGQSGDGGVYITASDTNAPYLSVFTQAGSPWDTITTHLRLGNLNGFLGYATDLYGIAIGNNNEYFKYDPTNGVRISGTLTVNSIPYLPSDSGLIRYWSFDESNGTLVKDYSITGSDGTITGATYVAGISGSQLSFNGTSDFVTLIYANIGGTLTYSMWVTPLGTDAINQGRFFCFMSTLIQVGSTAITFYPNTVSGATYSASYTFTVGTTYHIVVTQTGTTSEVFVNGVSLGSQTTQAINTANNANFIGKYSQFFYGKVDEVRIYNRVLALKEIEALYLNPSGNTQQGVKQLGGQYQSATSGALFKFDNTQFYIQDDTSTQAFKAFLSGTDVGDIQLGNYSGGTGILWDKSAAAMIIKGSEFQFGKSSYAATTAGIFIGTDGGLLKFNLGADANNYFKFFGTPVGDSVFEFKGGVNFYDGSYFYTTLVEVSGLDTDYGSLTAKSQASIIDSDARFSNDGSLFVPYLSENFNFVHLDFLENPAALASTVITKAYLSGGGMNGTQAIVAADSSDPQSLYLQTTATSTSSSYVQSYAQFYGDGFMEANFKWSYSSDAYIFIGFYVDATHYMGFKVDTSVSTTKANFEVNNGGSSVDTELGLTLAILNNIGYKIRIKVSGGDWEVWSVTGDLSTLIGSGSGGLSSSLMYVRCDINNVSTSNNNTLRIKNLRYGETN